MSLVRLIAASEIPTGTTRYFLLESGPILLANYEGTIYAVSGTCPHHWNPLEGAILCGPLVECPFHNYQFDCRTGENIYPSKSFPAAVQEMGVIAASLKRYIVEVRNGDVWVNLP